MIKQKYNHAIIVVLLAQTFFLAFQMISIVPLPFQLADLTASNAPLTVEQQHLVAPFTGKQVSVRACLLFYDGSPNYEVFKAWIEYHNKRWGLTHVDVFVTEKMSDMSDILRYASLGSVKIEVFYTHLHEKPVLQHYFGQRQTVMMNRVLRNAKLYNNTFVIYTDPDEFVVSEDFQDFEEMFERGHDAVSFPVFGSNYHLCSDNALHFGSLGYQSLRPLSSSISTNASLDYYTDPKLACSGNRKFVVRAEKWDHIDFVHDPLNCSRTEMVSRILDLTGRRQDGQHARVLHLRGGVGIHSDLSMKGCVKVRSCKYLVYHGECTNELKDATWELKTSEMTELLKDHPLFPDVAQVSVDAVCYAERYPSVRKEYCDDNVTKCRYGSLYSHFQDIGRQENLTWGCKVYLQ